MLPLSPVRECAIIPEFHRKCLLSVLKSDFKDLDFGLNIAAAHQNGGHGHDVAGALDGAAAAGCGRGVEGLHLVADELGVGPGLGSAGHADPHLAGLFVVLEVRVPVQAVAADESNFSSSNTPGATSSRRSLMMSRASLPRATQPGPP